MAAPARPALQADTALGAYLATSGGSFHPALFPKQDEYGTSIYTSETLAPGTKVVCCPFSLAITPTQVRREALPLAFFPPPADPREDDDRRLMVLYLVLHLLPAPLLSSLREQQGLHLAHEAYISALPAATTLRTPLYFTSAERSLLRGTNLDGATRDREQQWRAEWEEVRRRLEGADVEGEVRREVTWERWLWACTMLSSRAFPSSLIDNDQPNSTPVLFPGIDLLNHRPTARVTWSSDVRGAGSGSVTGGEEKGGSLTIVLDELVPAGTQVFNTYGAKSNEELLLGYGFVLPSPPSNPADILALKLSLPSPDSSAVYSKLHDLLARLGLQEPRHTVPPSGVLPPALLTQMRLLLLASTDPSSFLAMVEELSHLSEKEEALEKLAFLGWENELDVLDALEGMLEAKAEGLSAVNVDAEAAAQPSVRSEVKEMIKIYRRGQLQIVEAALAHREQLFEATLERARAEGVELAFEEEEDEDEEEGSIEGEGEE
ncbi:hypothetical protein JCM10908_005181 [Rhodotorula pacifica]|uniref:SET domain-containing protein n=1 Tax=Rhodotorula pacifica TaxID=1495444 RepID=UPI00317E11C9